MNQSHFIRTLFYSVLLTLCLSARLWAQAAQTQTTPAHATTVDYKRDVEPLLKARCYACHGQGARLGGLAMDTHSGLFAGGQSGPVVVPGSPDKSLLLKLVSGSDPARTMPARGPRLTASEIGVLRAWIAGGAKMGVVETGTDWRPTLALRRPDVPTSSGTTPGANAIDLLLQSYYKQHKIAPAPPVEDRVYARRVYLDLIGLLPTPAQQEAFARDKRPDKRARLADSLLADNPNYAAHWLTFWNDMLRNDYAGTGYIDGGRTQITGWLRNALQSNLPYDRFVRQLVNPTPDSAGFVNGIVWRGVVNASQTPPMQAAQNIAQVFMGVNLKCASCHDSFVSTWKLADAYGMASIYADRPLELIRCDKPTGQTALVKFIYPELGAIDGAAPKLKRQEQLADALTCRANGRMARTLVNRLWARLMGRGLVEPTDEMDRRPFAPEVLDWLAWDFAEHGYDIKRALRQIVTSQAYQRPAMSLQSERQSDFVFAGPVVKRLSAEQYIDALAALTGIAPLPAPGGTLPIHDGLPVLPPGGNAQIRYQSDVLRSGSVPIDIDVTGAQTLFLIATDAGDGSALDWADWTQPILVGALGETRLTGLKPAWTTTGYGQVEINRSVVQKPLRLGDQTFANGIGAHANSVLAYRLPPGTTRFLCVAGPDTGAVEQSNAMAKTGASIRLFVVTGDASLLTTRASLANADSLMRALDRPNREQVVTERSTVATTLQALELTNGQTLAALLDAGADRWMTDTNNNPNLLLTRLYQTALGRTPTLAERQVALELLGTPMQKTGVEDLLWIVVMLPEFQLVY